MNMPNHLGHPGLIAVEKTIARPGSIPFQQKFYIRPGGLADHKPTNSADSNKGLSSNVKQDVNSFYDKFTDKLDFFKVLKNNGVSWKDSDIPGVTLMRAKMAMGVATSNGLKIKDDSSEKKVSAPSQFESDTKDSHKTPTELAQDFIDSFAEPKEFCRAMESMKIRYNRSYDPQQNFLAAQKSLIENITNGINVPALWKMDTKALYDSLPTPPPVNLPEIVSSPSSPKSFETADEVNNFFLGNSNFDSHTSDSPYGKWEKSGDPGPYRDMDDGENKSETELEQKMINIYTRHSRDFNHWLRNTFEAKTWGIGSFNDIPQIIHFFRRAKFMDAAINRFEVPHPITVHRHMPCTPELLDKILKAPNGIFSDDSYMSTSCISKMDPQLAKKFQQTLKWNETSGHLEIDIPQGKGWGMYVARNSAYPNQCEFLLARGSQLQITDIKKQPDGTYYVKCKLIGNAPKDVTKLKYRQFIKRSSQFQVIDAELLKSELLETKYENPYERFIENGLNFILTDKAPALKRKVEWK